jgi:predicted exporter
MTRVGLWLLLLLGCCLLILGRGRVQSDISLFLPSAATAKDELLVNELREGPASRLILLAIEGGSEEQRAESSRLLAKALRGSELFVRVVNGEQTVSREEQAILFDYRYLIGPRAEAGGFQVEALHQAFDRRLRDLRSPMSTLHKQLVARDPTGVMLAMAGTLQGQEQPAQRQGVWFSDNGQRALLLAETVAGGFDLDRQEESVREIKAAFAPLAASQGTTLLLSGPGVYGVLSRELIRTESTRLSVAASVLVCLLMLVSYRSLPLLLLGTLPVLAAVVAGVATVTAVYGAIHGITLAFGITLLGVSVDYPLHLFSHLHSGETPAATLARVWPTMLLGALTTCFGFLAMLHTGFSGLAQLALFAIAGLLASVSTTRWVLPPLLALAGRAGSRLDRCGRGRRLPAPGRITRSVAVAAGILALLSVILLHRSPWEDDLAALSPIAPELINLDRELRADLGAPEISHMVVLKGASAEEVLQACEILSPALERLRERKALAGYLPPTQFLPSRQAQLARQEALPAEEVLQAAVAEAQACLPFKAGFFTHFVEDVARSRTMAPLTLQDLEGTALGLRLATQLVDTGKGFLAIIPLAGVHDQQAVAAAVAGTAGAAGFALNLREETGRLVREFRNGALNGLGLGLLGIVAALAVGLRSLAGVVRILTPVFLALAIDLAGLLWSGERLSLFHLVSLLLVLGIALDYSLFFNRQGDSEEFRRRTLHALVLCALSTLLVFGLLAASHIPVLKAIGKTVAFGVLAGFVLSMVLARPAGSEA